MKKDKEQERAEAFLYVFRSTHHAIKFESTWKEHHKQVTILPVPREISASCGLAVRVEGTLTAVKDFVSQQQLEVAGMYRIVYDEEKKRYEPLEGDENA